MRELVALPTVVTPLVDEGAGLVQAVVTSLVDEGADRCAGCGHVTSG